METCSDTETCAPSSRRGGGGPQPSGSSKDERIIRGCPSDLSIAAPPDRLGPTESALRLLPATEINWTRSTRRRSSVVRIG